MALYDYRAIDDYGKSVDGQLEARDEKELEEKLAEKGYYLLEAKERWAIIKAPRTVVPPEGADKVVTKSVGTPQDIHLHKHEHYEASIHLPFILGLTGLLLIIGGCFAPFITIPVLGSIALFLDGRGDGMGIVVLSGVAIWLLLIKRYKAMLIPVGLSAGVTLADVIYFVHLKTYESSPSPIPNFNNPFEAAGYELGQRLGGALIKSVHLSWGVGLLIVGHILVFVAIGIGIKERSGKYTV